MSSRTLRGWYSGALAWGTPPQRAESTAWTGDRWLSALQSRVFLYVGHLARYRLARAAERIVRASDAMRVLTDEDLHARGTRLRRALQADGMTKPLVGESFALIREASRRTLGKAHYPVQILGGLALLDGRLAEMATGEGKTLTALLPVVTVAFAGVPVHVVTVNEYLARRDAELLKPVMDFFGISVGVVTHLESDAERRAAYGRDVAYCVNKDLVFDHLRDGIDAAGGLSPSRQRGLFYALIDEADSVLVDEARTPLVIAREHTDRGGRADASRALAVARQLLHPNDYAKDDKARSVRLTVDGRRRVATLMALDVGVWAIAKARDERIEQALTARIFFRRDDNYVVRDGKVQIVDEFTGRILPDRTWERGLHQMIELIEGCEASLPRETIARQTYPRFFSRYLRIAGMTGTATEVAGELGAEYGLRVIRIPTHRRSRRRFVRARLFTTDALRWQHVAETALEIAATGRAVLIGTRSVAASETVAASLARLGADAAVLNARQDEHEAEIVAQAGRRGRITIATNMAGRGTDILLDRDVRASGGLHVILTEYHESARIDRQLFGRAARQGDPGSCESCVSMDDELFTTHARLELALLRRFGGERIAFGSRITALMRRLSQARAEKRNAAVRKAAIHNDRLRGRSLAFAGIDD